VGLSANVVVITRRDGTPFSTSPSIPPSENEKLGQRCIPFSKTISFTISGSPHEAGNESMPVTIEKGDETARPHLTI
jgi:hypothetical protein